MYSPDASIVRTVFHRTKQFYDKIKSLYENSGYSETYPLNTFWGGQNMRDLLKLIKSDENPLKMLSGVLATPMFSHNALDRETVARQTDWWIEFLSSQYRLDLNSLDMAIQESPMTNPKTHVVRGGRLLSPDFLRHLVTNLEIKKYCELPARKFNVVELGAGYGGAARIMKLLYPRTSYVIIDIPETLLFASIFLGLNFPNARFCYVTDADTVRGCVDKYDFFSFPPCLQTHSLRIALSCFATPALSGR